MKRTFGFLMLGALAWALTSCSDEAPTAEPVDAAQGLSFRITTPSEPLVLTRAIASNNEWKIATLDVYAAESGVVTKLAATDFSISPTLGTTTPNQTYTVTMNNEWLNANSGKTVNFYFVGNDASSTNGAHASLPTNLAINEAAFKNSLTSALATQGPDTLKTILKPNGTINLLFSSDIQGVTVSGKVQETSQLKRREARFDIENKNVSGTNPLVVTGIEVINAADAGLIFGVGDAATPGINRTHNHFLPALDGSAYTQFAPDSDSVAFDLAPSVFYLYPTTLVTPSTGATQTQIIVTGTYKGETVKYPVTVATSTQINANYRYILNIDPITGKVELQEEDYEEGGTLIGGPGENSTLATLTPLSAAIVGTGTYTTRDANVFSSSDLTETTLSIEASSDFGTTWTLTPASAASDVTVVRNITRAFSGTSELYTVTIKPGDSHVDAVLTIDSGEVGSESFIIRRLAGGDASAILYFAADGTLQAKSWADIQTEMGAGATASAALAYFKFGSVIGFDNMRQGDAVSGSTTWNADMSAIKFNPTSLTVGASGANITAYAPATWNASTSNALPNIPAWVQEDWNAGIRNVSGPEYHNLANLKAGKGDPCKLVGIDPTTIASWDQAAFDAAMLAAEWRLPTVLENSAFVGGPADAFVDTEMPAKGFWKSWVPFQNPAYLNYIYATTAWGAAAATEPRTVNENNRYDFFEIKSRNASGLDEAKFPVVANYNAKDSQILPAAGYRYYTSGAVTYQGTNGYWWSSTPYNGSNGHNLYFYSNSVYPVLNSNSAYGFSVRCVRS